MEDDSHFLVQVLNSISEHIAVIDDTGNIKYVNQRWSSFGVNNQLKCEGNLVGENYLTVCDNAALVGDVFGKAAAKGIRSVMSEAEPDFYLEYPCHSDTQKHWFMMRVTPFKLRGQCYFVLVHQEVTERKLAEEKVSALAREDSLTDLPNRRALDEFLALKWKQSCSLNEPVMLAMLDLDYFKQLNDCYGHQAGDACLFRIGQKLREFMVGRGGMCARYGGEEFVIVLEKSTVEDAVDALRQLLAQISELKIANKNAPNYGYITASIGVAALQPNNENRPEDLLNKADDMLYKAKSSGRNKLMYFTNQSLQVQGEIS